MPKEGSCHAARRFRVLWGALGSESSEDSPLTELRRGPAREGDNELSFFGGFSRGPPLGQRVAARAARTFPDVSPSSIDVFFKPLDLGVLRAGNSYFSVEQRQLDPVVQCRA
ncbi:unnamed protein product [Symbiodinium sp. CCMP2456]|nr:unnamed protein product [Symbiodinium sp. CCMP2456]